MFERLRRFFAAKPAPAPDPRELFTREVEAWLRAAPGIARVTRVPGDFSLELVARAGTVRSYLGNLFADVAITVADPRVRVN